MNPLLPETRPVVHRYADPLEVIWTACAERVGFKIERSPDVYASTDGKGTLLIGCDEILDADDSLAQMILHELCHALIEGEQGEALEDWGLDNTSNRDLPREHACLRLQAYLAASAGLRRFLAPTTDFRVSFWNRLGDDPFAATAVAGGRFEPSCVAARRGAWRATQPRWALPLSEALAATALIADTVSTAARPKPARGRRAGGLPLLWEAADTPPPRHPAGHASVATHLAGPGCAQCAWSFAFRGWQRCRHAPAVPLPEDTPACTRWEAAAELSCQGCGACCREAYQSVEVAPTEAVNRRHPALVESRDTHRRLLRQGERCAALAGSGTPAAPFACTIYADRPRACREFERGGAHCLEARRRVGLSL